MARLTGRLPVGLGAATLYRARMLAGEHGAPGPATDPHGASLGLPRGMMLADYDTPAASGDDGRLSRAVASAARAATLLADPSW